MPSSEEESLLKIFVADTELIKIVVNWTKIVPWVGTLAIRRPEGMCCSNIKGMHNTVVRHYGYPAGTVVLVIAIARCALVSRMASVEKK